MDGQNYQTDDCHESALSLCDVSVTVRLRLLIGNHGHRLKTG